MADNLANHIASVAAPAFERADHAVSRRYTSASIAERHARILEQTRKMIGDIGADKFTVRDLGQRARISVTTIYNIFGDKENLIAHALREFDSTIKLVLPQNCTRIKEFLRAIATTTSIVIDNRTYSLALADLYFSRSLAPELFDVIRGMPLHVFTHWRQLAERDGFLREGVGARTLDTSFANMEWATIKDWGAGRLNDGDLAGARQRGFLLIVAAIARGSLAKTAVSLLHD
jgi:AcrR family transcriptional regulator